jgi:hypothetical protein
LASIRMPVFEPKNKEFKLEFRLFAPPGQYPSHGPSGSLSLYIHTCYYLLSDLSAATVQNSNIVQNDGLYKMSYICVLYIFYICLYAPLALTHMYYTQVIIASSWLHTIPLANLSTATERQTPAYRRSRTRAVPRLRSSTWHPFCAATAVHCKRSVLIC